MSGFILPWINTGINAILGSNCGGSVVGGDALQPVDYRLTPPVNSGYLDRDVDVLWPRSSFTGQSDYANLAPVWEAMHQWWEWFVPSTGQRSPKKISGVARDANGNPLAGVTVLLFNTSTGLLVDTQVSAADGTYTLSDPNNTTNFEVAYLAGSPDVAGTTVNNLTGV